MDSNEYEANTADEKTDGGGLGVRVAPFPAHNGVRKETGGDG